MNEAYSVRPTPIYKGRKPVAIPALAKTPGRTDRPAPIPYNVAFREVTAFVTKELDTIGEQWNDQAKQDLISTILIAAAKQGILTIWERERAADQH